MHACLSVSVSHVCKPVCLSRYHTHACLSVCLGITCTIPALSQLGSHCWAYMPESQCGGVRWLSKAGGGASEESGSRGFLCLDGSAELEEPLSYPQDSPSDSPLNHRHSQPAILNEILITPPLLQRLLCSLTFCQALGCPFLTSPFRCDPPRPQISPMAFI